MARRTDGAAKTSGAAQYCADALPRGHLFGAVLTTSSAHARVEVDVELLRSLPGVVAALGPADDPGRPFTNNPHGGVKDCSVFAAVGRFPGDIVGAVAARDRASLERALAHPAVIREEQLPPVLSLDAGIQAIAIANPAYPANIIASVDVGAPWEQVAAALEASPRRHRSEVSLGSAPHGFLERVAAGAQWLNDRCSIWSTTQCPWLVRSELASFLGVAEDDVEMEPVYVGGGFGGKEEMALEPAAALLSRACDGQAVLIELSREQCTRRYRVRHGGRIEAETGFDERGRFLARYLRVTFEAGPYNGHSENVVTNAVMSGLRLYPGGVVGGHGLAVATNRVQGAAYRGYGATQASFAVETHVEGIAARLGIESMALRRMNAALPAMVDPETAAPMSKVRALECLSALDDHLGAPLESDDLASRYRRGRGIAQVVCTSAAASPKEADTAEVGCRFDAAQGRIVVETSTAEAGQGIYEAIAAGVRRALAGSTVEIVVEPSRSGNAKADAGMFGSRGANVTSSAAMRAAGLLRERVVAAAAGRLGVAVAEVILAPDWRSACTASDGSPSSSIELCALGEVSVSAIHATNDVGLSFGAQAADITVDTATGEITVDRFLSVHDVGVVVSPATARAQIEGGVIQGIGGALYEYLTFEESGLGFESGFLGHLMPTLVALPSVEVVFVEETTTSTESTGAKGLGEAPVMGVAAAISNAIRSAVGVEALTFPLRPEALLRLLQDQTQA